MGVGGDRRRLGGFECDFGQTHSGRKQGAAMNLSDQVARWLVDAERKAAALATLKTPYHDAVNELMFFYTRALVAKCGGSKRKAGVAAQVHDKTVGRAVTPKNGRLAPAAKTIAEAWATGLANEGATYSEAMFVFKRTILLAAITATKGNRLEASRNLQVHRNTVWRIPQSPDEMRPARARNEAA
jgi:DNA-binding NtrC family response regulator